MKLGKIIMLVMLTGMVYNTVNAQVYLGGSSYSSPLDDFFSDFTLRNGHDYIMIKSTLFTYPETEYGSFLSKPYMLVNPKYLGCDFFEMKIETDVSENVYLAGISKPKIIGDTALFFTKINRDGGHVWSVTFQKNGDTVDLFRDGSGYFYLHDNHFLRRLNVDGTLLWQKEFRGKVLPVKNGFFNFDGRGVPPPGMLTGSFYDTLLLNKADGNGIIKSSMALLSGLEQNTLLSAGMSERVLGNRLFISGSFWGKVDFDPSTAEVIFTNYKLYWGIPQLQNFLAEFDTSGNLVRACTNSKFPDIRYFCSDSSTAIYMAGRISGPTNFFLVPGDSLIVTPGANDRSFIAKYTHDLRLIWIRKLTGYIQYLDTSFNSWLGMQQLDIAGDFNGTLNLNLARPADVTLTSYGWDTFYGNYVYLDSTISMLGVREENFQREVKVLPNPSSGTFTIAYSGTFRQFTMELTDLRGQCLFSRAYFENPGKETLDLSGFTNGLYLLEIKTSTGIICKKILLQK
jgi:hypothetical protein